jgi:hypothetical protein
MPVLVLLSNEASIDCSPEKANFMKDVYIAGPFVRLQLDNLVGLFPGALPKATRPLHGAFQ